MNSIIKFLFSILFIGGGVLIIMHVEQYASTIAICTGTVCCTIGFLMLPFSFLPFNLELGFKKKSKKEIESNTE